MSEHLDVAVVGAGISGIGAGYRLQTGRPGRSYAILEARDSMGGTWDLFRFPGGPLRLGHVHAQLPVQAVA
jgi:monooxygenase